MNNFGLSTENVSRGLYLQELIQNVTASNLAKTYLDKDGYLINSRQRVETVEGLPLLFNGASGTVALGTGPLIQQITRMRDLFLDSQIQQESSVVGKAETMMDTLNRVNSIVNPTVNGVASGNLDIALNNFAAAWTALAADPLNVALRSTVVNDGVAFATLANHQYAQLQNYQVGLNTNIQQTVDNINELLQQLSSFNKELATTQGANADSLLDARDYALDQLSRLVNIQSSIGPNGNVTVFLGNSSLALVDPAGAAILQTNAMNAHNPGLDDITLQSSEGTIYTDVSPSITGGQLGGLLQARDVTVEGYKTQVDQIATSVMNVTNFLHRSGYGADGAVTNTPFFTGTGAVDIQVNASIVADTTRNLVAASSRVGVTTNGQIAQFLGNLPNLLANNFVESGANVSVTAIDPTQPIGTQPFVTIPAGAGSFTIDGLTVNWTSGESVYQILDAINGIDPNVEAVFNASNGGSFYIFSNTAINIIDTSGNFTKVGQLDNVLVSTIRMNNGFAPTDTLIDYNDPLKPLAAQLGSTLPGTLLNHGPNIQAFRVTPGVAGSFILDGVTFNWTNTQSLAQIVNQIIAASNGGAFAGTRIAPVFNTTTQTLTIYSANSPRPIQLSDITGNFTVFTGLNGNTLIGQLSSGMLTQISSDVTAQQSVLDQANASLNQLNTAQANLGAVDTSSTGSGPGEPVAIEEQNAMNSLVAYNALLQVMQIIDQMYSDLVNAVGGTSNSTIFQQKAL